MNRDVLLSNGFEYNQDYDKEFPTNEHYSIMYETFKKTIVGDVEIHVTFNYKREGSIYKFKGKTVELVQGAEFQELPITEHRILFQLIDLLQGKSHRGKTVESM